MDYQLVYEAAYQAEMDSRWLYILSIFLGLVVNSGIITILFKKLQAKMERRADESEAKDVSKKMLLGLSHDRISFLAAKYIERGSITIEEYENISKYLYDPYSKMDGNGTIQRLMKAVEKLPISNKQQF